MSSGLTIVMYFENYDAVLQSFDNTKFAVASVFSILILVGILNNYEERMFLLKYLVSAKRYKYPLKS